jgi:hypothetical protein
MTIDSLGIVGGKIGDSFIIRRGRVMTRPYIESHKNMLVAYVVTSRLRIRTTFLLARIFLERRDRRRRDEKISDIEEAV